MVFDLPVNSDQVFCNNVCCEQLCERGNDNMVGMLVSACELGFRAQLRHQQFVRELVEEAIR
jgi:hypothetical protein